jgi:fatty-acyl-CoA synthase
MSVDLLEVSTIADLLRAAAESWDGDAAVFPDERATYPELDAKAREMAQGLRALGVGPRDKVAIFMPNCLDYVVALFAIAKLGAVSVPLNGRFKAYELSYVVGHSDARVLLVADRGSAQTESFDLLREIFPGLDDQDRRNLELPEAPALRQIVDLGSGDRPGILPHSEFFAGAATVASDEIELLQRRVRVRDVGVLMYTSGTTARPKGCLITHEALVRQGKMTAARGLKLQPGEGFWDPLPMFHTGGVMPLMATTASRAVFCHPGFFEPGAALDMIEQERCAVLFVMFDTIWMQVLNHPRYAEADVSSVRTLYMVGPPDRMRWFQEQMPTATVATSFGMTEVCAHLAIAGPDADEETRLTTAGPVQPELEARIVDLETGEDLPANETGDLLLRGPCLFEGYYKEPELTAKAIDPDGWFHTGDLGRLDDKGRFTFRGRSKDMLKVGGENVSPLEVEGFLAQHDAVNIVQVVSAPDARYTEVAAAFVELRPGASATEAELIEFCVGKIASYKVPRYVRFVTEWPMSGTKIQKYVLRQRIAEDLEEKGITEASRLEHLAREAQTAPDATVA